MDLHKFYADSDLVFHFTADPYPVFHFNSDPDPAFHFNAGPDTDPAHHQSDANLQPLFEPPSLASTAPVSA